MVSRVLVTRARMPSAALTSLLWSVARLNVSSITRLIPLIEARLTEVTQRMDVRCCFETYYHVSRILKD